MNFIGGEQFNFNPISSYNGILKGNVSFDLPKTEVNNNFDNVLKTEIDKMGLSNETTSDSSNLMNSISSGIENGLNSVNADKIKANSLQEALARGEDVSVHDLMIASEKSSLSLQMALQLRNKLVAAYTDIKNMNL